MGQVVRTVCTGTTSGVDAATVPAPSFFHNILIKSNCGLSWSFAKDATMTSYFRHFLEFLLNSASLFAFSS